MVVIRILEIQKVTSNSLLMKIRNSNSSKKFLVESNSQFKFNPTLVVCNTAIVTNLVFLVVIPRL